METNRVTGIKLYFLSGLRYIHFFIQVKLQGHVTFKKTKNNFSITHIQHKYLSPPEKWKVDGGVLLMGYEMFRLLSCKKSAPSKAKSRAKKPAGPEVIDVEAEDKNKGLMEGQFVLGF